MVLSFPAPVGDPLKWLAQQTALPRVYWRSRDGWEYAGAGAVHLIGMRGLEAMQKAASAAAEFLDHNVLAERAPMGRRPRFLGGFAFDPVRQDDFEWRNAGFGDAALVLPEALYIRHGNESYMLFAIPITPRDDAAVVPDQIRNLNERFWQGFHEDTVPLDNGDVLHGHFFPSDETPEYTQDRRRWINAARVIDTHIASGELSKVVLARRRQWALSVGDEPGIAWRILAALRGQDEISCPFGFQFHDQSAFLGVSPERLFRLSGRSFESECLAGTLRRQSVSADAQAAQRLLLSHKDRLEHEYVVRGMREALSEVCESCDVADEPEVVTLPALYHLCSPVKAQLKPGVGVGDLLQRLHPTPAVGGVPNDLARAAIRDFEPQSRGWYGGPVGWIGPGGAEFVVAIRSALLTGSHLWLYAGAGLVAGSVSEEEWQETEDKLQSFVTAVEQDPRRP
ncbi:MAG: isochorismate synthase [candidate division Zixibacteria bacterium]|nr:isochorismate synthase [candidate division Zixibacteria bacterium]